MAKLHWEGHECDTCKRQGHCPIEPIARFFGKNPEAEKEFKSYMEEDGCIGTSWQNTLDIYVASVRFESPIDTMILVCLATGFVLGKGGTVNPMEPDIASTLKAFLESLNKLASRTEADLGEN